MKRSALFWLASAARVSSGRSASSSRVSTTRTGRAAARAARERLREEQRELLLGVPAGADRAGLVAAVTGVDDDRADAPRRRVGAARSVGGAAAAALEDVEDQAERRCAGCSYSAARPAPARAGCVAARCRALRRSGSSTWGSRRRRHAPGRRPAPPRRLAAPRTMPVSRRLGELQHERGDALQVHQLDLERQLALRPAASTLRRRARRSQAKSSASERAEAPASSSSGTKQAGRRRSRAPAASVTISRPDGERRAPRRRARSCLADRRACSSARAGRHRAGLRGARRSVELDERPGRRSRRRRAAPATRRAHAPTPGADEAEHRIVVGRVLLSRTASGVEMQERPAVAHGSVRDVHPTRATGGSARERRRDRQESTGRRHRRRENSTRARRPAGVCGMLRDVLGAADRSCASREGTRWRSASSASC